MLDTQLAHFGYVDQLCSSTTKQQFVDYTYQSAAEESRKAQAQFESWAARPTAELDGGRGRTGGRVAAHDQHRRPRTSVVPRQQRRGRSCFTFNDLPKPIRSLSCPVLCIK